MQKSIILFLTRHKSINFLEMIFFVEKLLKQRWEAQQLFILA